MFIFIDLVYLMLDIIGRCVFGYYFNIVFLGEIEILSVFFVVIKGIGFGWIMKKRFFLLYDYFLVIENKRVKEVIELIDGIVFEVRL